MDTSHIFWVLNNGILIVFIHDFIPFGAILSLKKCTIADLQNLSPHGPSHLHPFSLV